MHSEIHKLILFRISDNFFNSGKSQLLYLRERGHLEDLDVDGEDSIKTDLQEMRLGWGGSGLD
jgi:hypothetical protein